jgi:UDP-N-acetylglucosamine 1-carboxyvinyltransferase
MARATALPDRIETGTYAMAVAMTGGDVLLKRARGAAAVGARRPGAGGRGITPTNTGCGSRATARIGSVEVSTSLFPASRPTCRRSSAL